MKNKTSQKALRAGIVGLGRIGTLLEKDPLRLKPCTHAGAYHRHPDVNLVAGCDVDAKRREQFAGDWAIPEDRIYDSYVRMLNSEQLDLVSICAFAPQRLEMIEAAVESGVKGLWIEKALGCSLREADSIRKLIDSSGVTAVVDYPRRARAPYRAVKRMIESGEIGKLQSVSCYMNGQLLHTGTHAFDVLRFWCGEAVRVLGKLGHPVSGVKLSDQGGTGVIEFGSGVSAFISAVPKSYYIFQFDLIFEAGRVQLGNDVCKGYVPGESRLYSGIRELFESESFDWKDPHREDLLQDLLDSLSSGDPPIASVSHAVEALRLGLALFESDRRGNTWVEPREVPGDLTVESV